MSKKILFVDACLRENSRTRRLAEALLASLDGEVERLSLGDADLPKMDDAMVNARNAACSVGRFERPIYRFAKQFAEADEIVIAAPFWDMSFPAILKKYIEAVTVSGITFKYSDEGVPIGLCRAGRLYYVTTAGGPTFGNQFGYGYIKALAQGMYGIADVQYISLENLDIVGNDPEKMLAEAIKEIPTSLRSSE